jgi:hypothetical protein
METYYLHDFFLDDLPQQSGNINNFHSYRTNEQQQPILQEKKGIV